MAHKKLIQLLLGELNECIACKFAELRTARKSQEIMHALYEAFNVQFRGIRHLPLLLSEAFIDSIFLALYNGCRVLGPVPDFSPESTRINAHEEFEALKSVNFRLLLLIVLHSKKYHGQNRL